MGGGGDIRDDSAERFKISAESQVVHCKTQGWALVLLWLCMVLGCVGFVVVFDELFDCLKNNSYVICLDFKCCASVPTSHSDAWYFTW